MGTFRGFLSHACMFVLMINTSKENGGWDPTNNLLSKKQKLYSESITVSDFISGFC